MMFSRVLGSGKPIIIIHGLFGMSDNWNTIAKKLSPFFEVHLIDLRNHGPIIPSISEKVLSYIINSLLYSLKESMLGRIMAELRIERGMVYSKASIMLISNT